MNDKPMLYLFYCANCLDAQALRQCGTLEQGDVKSISLPCAGKVDLLYLLKAFEKGADGVLLVTCPQGECNFLEGNLRARKRSAAVDALLLEIGLSGERMRTVQLDRQKDNHSQVQRVMAEIDGLSQSIRGANGTIR